MDIRSLAKGDHETWRDFLAPILADRETSPDGRLVQQLLRIAPHTRWFELARAAIEADDSQFTKLRPQRRFEEWFIRSALLRSKIDDERTWPLRKHKIRTTPGSDGGYEEAQELYRAQVGNVGDEELAETALMVARGAMTVRKWDEAESYAESAVEAYSNLGDDQNRDSATRRLAGALLHRGEFQRALALLRKPMMSRGPLFGGGGTTVHTRSDDPFESAVDEAATVATWATHWTPEWIRALGAIAERAPNADVSEYIWDYLDVALPVAFENWSNPESDIEVVVRHSGERGLLLTPLFVLRRYVQAWPNDEWAHKQIETINEYLELDRMKAQLESDPDAAVVALLARFDAFEESGELGEDNRSIAVLETLLQHFIGTQDRRAFELQQRMYDDKLRKYGQAPATWLELQNIGSIHAEFGERERALELFEEALQHQIAFFGEDHHALDLTRRNIARMKAGE